MGSLEHGTVKNVADGSVGRLHLFQAKLLHTGFVGRHGGTFDGYAVLFDGVGGVDGCLIIGLVAVFDSQVVILDVYLDVKQEAVYPLINLQMMRS